MTGVAPDGPGWKFANRRCKGSIRILGESLSFWNLNIIFGISAFAAEMPWPRFEAWLQDTQTLAEVPGCLFKTSTHAGWEYCLGDLMACYW